jgi:predicted secreted Zn-dependent protease
MMLGLAAAVANGQATAPVAPVAPAAPVAAGRGLKDLAGTTISYYDVAGKKGPEIQNSLKALDADPAAKDKYGLYSWDVGARITKRTTGTVCTVDSSKATFTAKVNLPRLKDEAKVDKAILPNWRTYVGTLESQAASDLWFIHDRLPQLEQSMAKISCDQAAAKWNTGLAAIKAELVAKITARAAARAAAASAAAAAPPPKKK